MMNLKTGDEETFAGTGAIAFEFTAKIGSPHHCGKQERSEIIITGAI